MIKTILASLTGFASDRTVLDAAIAAASIWDGHVHCLHTRIDVVEAVAQSGAPGPYGILSAADGIAREEQQRASHARAAFDDACIRHSLRVQDEPAIGGGVTISWTEMKSLLNELLDQALYHDLVVMARDAELSCERLKSTILQTGRPVLIAPPKPVASVGHKVVIAWRAGPDAARALTAAAPFLSRAEQISIVSVSGNMDNAESDRISAQRLARLMRWHGTKAQVTIDHQFPGSTSGKIQEFACNCEADLIVMGAYGHSRLQEFVLGGVTDSIISECALPVLMFH